MNFSMILAMDEKNGIGKDNDLAWHIPGDMKYFKEITSNTKDLSKFNSVIMGRKTWESIPSKYRPLPNRVNCILSRTLKVESTSSKIDDFVLYFNNFDHCLKELDSKDNIENIFLIGGGSLYNQFLNHPNLEKIYMTRVLGDYNCDVYFDGIPKNFKLELQGTKIEDKGFQYRFEIWSK